MKYEPGTLWVAPNGDAYRLRDYSIDWKAEPFTGEHVKPSYSVSTTEGYATTRYELPPGSTQVWEPVAERLDVSS